MTDYAATGVYVSKQVNMEGMVLVEYELTAALNSGEKLTLTLPAGVDKAMVPIAMSIWSNADPRLWLAATGNAVLTSHNKSTGATVITAGASGVADSSTISILYVPSTIGT